MITNSIDKNISKEEIEFNMEALGYNGGVMECAEVAFIVTLATGLYNVGLINKNLLKQYAKTLPVNEQPYKDIYEKALEKTVKNAPMAFEFKDMPLIDHLRAIRIVCEGLGFTQDEMPLPIGRIDSLLVIAPDMEIFNKLMTDIGVEL